jgi:hypothetical protein
MEQLLQQQLKEAQTIIKALREEVVTLKEKLARYENEESTVDIRSNGSEEEVFTESNSSNEEDFHQDFKTLNEEAEEEPRNEVVACNEPSPIPLAIPPISNKLNDKQHPPRITFRTLLAI